MSADHNPLDVLIVGAGPTGLALAAQLSAYGVGFRLVDAQLDRVHESRALTIQPRTLEVLAPFGVADQLVIQALMRRAEMIELAPAQNGYGLSLSTDGFPAAQPPIDRTNAEAAI